MILELEVRHPGDKEFMEKSFYLENLIGKRYQTSGWLRDGAKSNARTRRERTAMSLEGILASCMKAEKTASESQRKYSWERGPDREKGNEDGV